MSDTPNHTTKPCNRCNRELPLSQFQFHRGRYSNICRDCTNARRRARRRENPDFGKRKLKPIPTTRVCKICGIEKPLIPDNYHFKNDRPASFVCRQCSIEQRTRKRRAAGIKKQRRAKYDGEGNKCCANCGSWHPATPDYFVVNSARPDGLTAYCRKCRREYIKAFRSTPEQRERERLYRSTEEHKAKKREYARSPQGQETKRKWLARYRKTIHGAATIKAADHRRRAREERLPDGFSGQDWYRCLEYFGGCCAVCGRPPGLWHKLAIDHWIPIASSECPGSIPTNIVPLCQGVGGCNNSKHCKAPNDWLVEKFGKRKATSILKRINAYFDWIRSVSSPDLD